MTVRANGRARCARGDCLNNEAWEPRGSGHICRHETRCPIGTSNSLFLRFCVIGYVCAGVCVCLCAYRWICVCSSSFVYLIFFSLYAIHSHSSSSIWFHFSVPLAFTLPGVYAISHCDTYHALVCACALLFVSRVPSCQRYRHGALPFQPCTVFGTVQIFFLVAEWN